VSCRTAHHEKVTSQLEEPLWEIDRMPNTLDELALDTLGGSNVVPTNVWHFDDGYFASSRWIGITRENRKFSMVTPGESSTSASIVPSSESIRSMYHESAA
jgi:hypothetical protein